MKRVARVVVAVLIAAVGIFTLIGFAIGWLPDLASAFRVQYGYVLVLAVAAFLLKQRAFALAAVALTIVNVATFVGLYLPAKARPGQSLRIVELNTQSATTGFESLAKFIDETDPDLLALLDLSPEWAREAGARFKYKKVLPISGGGGVGLFSKLELEDARLRYYATPGIPSITARIRVGSPIDLVVTHPLAPSRPSGYRDRNAQLDAIAGERARFGPDVIVIGDLNMTSWSHEFGKFTSQMRLVDTRKGFGVQPTWPDILGFGMIPIDHVLVSPSFSTAERRIGPGGASEHLPVFVDLRF